MTSSLKSHRTVDCLGLYCPMPVVRTREEIDKLEPGQILEVLADDPASEEDLKYFSKSTGHQLLQILKEGDKLRFFIKKVK